MSEITDLAIACRQAARAVVNRHQKLASLDLYRVMAQTMALCETVLKSNSAQIELRDLIAAEPGERNRAYVERGSDAYTLVCRFVFMGDESAANICRYAHALREAAKLEIGSANLFEHLRDRGGVNALYLRRPLDAQTISAKLIRLDRSISFPRNGAFTLSLRRGAHNVFAVLGVQPFPTPAGDRDG